jgi:hypothetical protein
MVIFAGLESDRQRQMPNVSWPDPHCLHVIRSILCLKGLWAYHVANAEGHQYDGVDGDLLRVAAVCKTLAWIMKR